MLVPLEDLSVSISLLSVAIQRSSMPGRWLVRFITIFSPSPSSLSFFSYISTCPQRLHSDGLLSSSQARSSSSVAVEAALPTGSPTSGPGVSPAVPGWPVLPSSRTPTSSSPSPPTSGTGSISTRAATTSSPDTCTSMTMSSRCSTTTLLRSGAPSRRVAQ